MSQVVLSLVILLPQLSKCHHAQLHSYFKLRGKNEPFTWHSHIGFLGAERKGSARIECEIISNLSWAALEVGLRAKIKPVFTRTIFFTGWKSDTAARFSKSAKISSFLMSLYVCSSVKSSSARQLNISWVLVVNTNG